VNVLNNTTHVGLSQPKSGAQERCANLARQLSAGDNSVIVLEAAEFVGRTLRVFRDLAPSFARGVISILREIAVAPIQMIAHPSGAFAVKLATLLTASGAPLVYAPHNVESELVGETFSNDLQHTRIERFVLPARLGANARKLLEAKYTWDAISAQLLGVYKHVLGGRHGP
jgi:glycosyltransferase involved in cell wall biosynthesis